MTAERIIAFLKINSRFLPIITAGGYWAADKPHSWIKDRLEKPDSETNVVFCKEISAGISGMHKYIPKGFTFLIRHPYKVFDTFKRAVKRGVIDESKGMKLSEMPEFLVPSGFFSKDEYDVY